MGEIVYLHEPPVSRGPVFAAPVDFATDGRKYYPELQRKVDEAYEILAQSERRVKDQLPKIEKHFGALQQVLRLAASQDHELYVESLGAYLELQLRAIKAAVVRWRMIQNFTWIC